MSLRERLLLTRPVWLQLRANAAAALHVLRTEPPGVSGGPTPWDWRSAGGRERGWTWASRPVRSQTFLVRRSNTRQCQALCVRLPQASGPSFVSSHYIQESPGGERAWPGGKGLAAVRSGPREIPQRTTSLPISQASPWRALSSSSRTWSSSSAPTATPGEPAHRRLLSVGHPAPPHPCSHSQPRSPRHPSPLTFWPSLWPQGHPSPPASAPQSHPPGSHP